MLGNSTQLRILSVYRNQLTGEIPADLGRYLDLNVIEVLENQLTGPLPPYACINGKLQYILVLSNLLTGPIPLAYAECTPLIRFRVSLTDPVLLLCLRPSLRRGLAGDVWVVGVCALVCAVAILALARR